MKFEHAQKADLDQIIDLRHRAFERMAPNFYTPVEVENLLGDYDKDQLTRMICDNRLFCYLKNGNLLGIVGWEEDRIRHLYVDPNQFGLGIGTNLLKHAICDFQQRTQHDSVLAGVIVYARPFYEKCGFQVEAKKTAWDGSEYFQMRRKLD